MQKRHKIKTKKPKKPFLAHPIITIALLLVFVGLARGAFHINEKKQKAQYELGLTLQNLEHLEGRETALQGKVEALSTEQGIEQAIRDKFRVVKEGEEIIVILEDDIPHKTEVQTTEKESIFQGIKGWFQ